ncbi:excinuclease ABC subunit UvrB [Alphaproteobacteria bacterium endosymbiont of Tiliacea citrago]|uniref:excinuclease ABC subunit UvrB n=1 Tax=Alphaproteobacteria bacterium endosymbiont of Tiliacea citrago TaxID=3077944 RepID=UPI00313DB4CC
MFKLISDYLPAGDQPSAIKEITDNIKNGVQTQTLLGVTGSGKTFTMANIIQELNLPALIMAPNKILSAQLYEEFKAFFPENAVEYFVSYYDYYRPEAYLPHQGLYLEKEASINETIDQLRHKATRSLIERKDVIIVASVSCLYGIGSYEAYTDAAFKLSLGDKISSANLTRRLNSICYEVSADILRGKVKAQGEFIWIGPSHLMDTVWRIKITNNKVVSITEMDPLNRSCILEREFVTIFPNSHHIMQEASLSSAIHNIEKDLSVQLSSLIEDGKLAEAQRLEEKVRYDLSLLRSSHSCPGIENYSRYFTGRKQGEHPPTLYEYFPRPFLLFVDESHISIPQIDGMSKGDSVRKESLVQYGFRLPSAKDNRPMKFDEWDKMRSLTVFVSATPGEYEKQNTNFVRQIIRPTGLLDPVCEVKTTQNQVEDSIAEAKKVISNGDRVLMLTLTKKTAENLSSYLSKNGLSVAYLHGELTTLERIEKLYQFRTGEIDIIVGVNLLREGIDVPECALICIFEADFEGFLRTERSLIQMIGRAARHLEGRVILYADKETNAMKAALEETANRRELQIKFNKDNGIIPQKLNKKISEAFTPFLTKLEQKTDLIHLKAKDRAKMLKQIDKELKKLIKEQKFEEAAKVRDKRNALLSLELV